MASYYLFITKYTKNFLHVLVSSVEVLKKICSVIEKMNLCEGNDEDFLVEMIKRKGGVVRNGEVVTSYLDMITI